MSTVKWFEWIKSFQSNLSVVNSLIMCHEHKICYKDISKTTADRAYRDAIIIEFLFLCVFFPRNSMDFKNKMNAPRRASKCKINYSNYRIIIIIQQLNNQMVPPLETHLIRSRDNYRQTSWKHEMFIISYVFQSFCAMYTVFVLKAIALFIVETQLHFLKVDWPRVCVMWLKTKNFKHYN